jgi:uncharacterized Zn-binding protein involved in type VI secretion
MPFPIARITDMGAHGDVMAMGSGNVLANNLGVHRQFDAFVCPIVGAGVTVGNVSPTVMVNGIPAAKLGSVGVCFGGTVIVTGSGNVNVG